MIRIIGIDPGLATFGLADVRITDHIQVAGVYVFRTETQSKKRRLRVADENSERLSIQVRRWLDVISGADSMNAQPDGSVDVIAIEGVSYPRNASSAAKIALSVGAVISFATQHRIPVLQYTPQELKKGTVGSASASKHDVQDYLSSKYDVPDLIDHTGNTVAKSHREHGYDALAAVHASLSSEVVTAYAAYLAKEYQKA